MSDDLIIGPPKVGALEFFRDGDTEESVGRARVNDMLSIVRQHVDSFVPSTETEDGRKAIASLAYKIARSKTALDDAGKKLNAELKEIPKRIDATRRHIRETLEDWQREVRAPLDAWEAAESDRIAKHKATIDKLMLVLSASGRDGFETLEQMIDYETWVRDLDCSPEAAEEFVEEYRLARETCLANTADMIDRKRKAEAAAEELAALRAQVAKQEAEAASQAQAERDADIAAAAAERAKADAEQKLAAEKQAEIDAEMKRLKDRAHMARINNEALSALVQLGIEKEVAKVALSAIAKGDVPHVKILY